MSLWMAIVYNKLGWNGLQNLLAREAPSWNSRIISSQSMRDEEYIFIISTAVAFNMTLSRCCSGTQSTLLLISTPSYINILSICITLSRGCSGTQNDT